MIGAIIDWAKERYEGWRFSRSVGDANRDGFLTQEEIMASLNNGRRDAIDPVFSRAAYARLREWYVDTQINYLQQQAEDGYVRPQAAAVLTVQAQLDGETRGDRERHYLRLIQADVQEHIDAARGLDERQLAEMRTLAREINVNPSLADSRRMETARGMLGMHELSAFSAVRLHDIDELADRLLTDADRRTLDEVAARRFREQRLEERQQGLIA